MANVINAEQLACDELKNELKLSPNAYFQTNVIMEVVAVVEVFDNEKILKEVEVNHTTNKGTINQTDERLNDVFS